MTHSIRRGMFRARIVPALAGLMIAGGLALVVSAPASATPAPQPPATISDENIDTSSLVQPEGTDKGRGSKGDDCQGDSRCTPIEWCDGEAVQGKTSANAIIGDGQHKPDCLQVPWAKIDDKDCCKAPPGGTVVIAIHNPNSVNVPVQVTVKTGDKEYTKNGWAKPGKTVIKLKKLKDGWYDITVHLFDCVFKHGHKAVKIDCKDVTPSHSPSGSPSPSVSPDVSQSPPASPSETSSSPAPGGGTGGGDNGDQLPLTGSQASLMAAGGAGLVGSGLLLFFLTRRFWRRNEVQFTAE